MITAPARAAEWRDGITGRRYLVLEVWEAGVLIGAVLAGLWWLLRSRQAGQQQAGGDL